VKRYNEIFDNQQLTIDDYLESIRNTDILKYRTKFIRSGDIVEIEVYPLYKTRKSKIEALVKKETRKEQKSLNNKNTRKHITRLINANFTKSDMWATFTYDNGNLPESIEQSEKDIKNYIRRLKRYLKKYGLPELKYIYITEHITDMQKSGRAHHHIVMNFHDRDIAEKFWTKGGRKHSRRLQPDDYGLEGLARYIAKPESKNTENRKYSKKYVPSKNLIKPEVVKRENLIRKRKAASLSLEQETAREFFEDLTTKEKWLKDGYDFLDMEVYKSNYISGVYLYVRMKKAPRKNIKSRRN